MRDGLGVQPGGQHAGQHPQLLRRQLARQYGDALQVLGQGLLLVVLHRGMAPARQGEGAHGTAPLAGALGPNLQGALGDFTELGRLNNIQESSPFRQRGREHRQLVHVHHGPLCDLLPLLGLAVRLRGHAGGPPRRRDPFPGGRHQRGQRRGHGLPLQPRVLDLLRRDVLLDPGPVLDPLPHRFLPLGRPLGGIAAADPDGIHRDAWGGDSGIPLAAGRGAEKLRIPVQPFL
mmetsp:Transcript_94763/g.253481  ORF Transcript_94763/g.253481 Transcript_94763/m.253481 type:complete len:232 (+) Transcript_94763:1305-2000(+)